MSYLVVFRHIFNRIHLPSLQMFIVNYSLFIYYQKSLMPLTRTSVSKVSLAISKPSPSLQKVSFMTLSHIVLETSSAWNCSVSFLSSPQKDYQGTASYWMETKLLAQVEWEKDCRGTGAERRGAEVNISNTSSSSWGSPQDSIATQSVGGYVPPSTRPGEIPC